MYITILEIILVIFFAYYFYTKEKPKIKFFILGIVFSLLSLLLQLPLRMAEVELSEFLISDTLPFLLIAIGAPIISELTKYFSLKKYLKTRSQKNGIFFGIGWVGIESISFFSLWIYSKVFSFFNLMYQPSALVSSTLPLWSFTFIFIINLAITVLVVFSITKKKWQYLLYAILYSSIIYIVLHETTNKIFFQTIFFLYSLFIIFRYRLFK